MLPAGFLPRAPVLFSQLGSNKPLSPPTFRLWAPRGAQVSGAPRSAREPALPPQGRSRLHPRERRNGGPPSLRRGREGRSPRPSNSREELLFRRGTCRSGSGAGAPSGEQRRPGALGGTCTAPTPPAAPRPLGKADGGAAPSPPSRGSRPPPTLGPGRCGAHPAREGAREARLNRSPGLTGPANP